MVDTVQGQGILTEVAKEEPPAIAPAIETTTEELRLEFIPYQLHRNSDRLMVQLGMLMLSAATDATNELTRIDPANPALVGIGKKLEEVAKLTKEVQKVEQVIDVARRTANNALYGTESIHDAIVVGTATGRVSV